MIVRGEESCLGACLDSVAGADELVVVDTSLPTDAPDRTVEIAEEHGAMVSSFPWCDDFAKARNYSLNLCTGDWVLVVDADEVLEGGIGAVRYAIRGAQSINARAVSVRTVAVRGGEEHRSIRAFRRSPEIWWEGAVHNYLVIPICEAFISDVVVQYGYSDAHKRDPNRALRILTRVLQENPTAVREAYYLAREHWYRADYAGAARWYRDYLTRATWAPEMADAYLMLARCLWRLRRGDEARTACLRAIQINADFKEALVLMAEMSGPKNRRCWMSYAAAATNEDVLFVRGRA